MKNKSKLTLKSEKVRTLRSAELRAAAAGVETAPSPSFIYSCVVSCTFTSDCTTSTTF